MVQLSFDELEELFDMRSVLEAFAMRLICQRISQETIDKLSHYVEASETAMNGKNPIGVFESNTSFHNTLYTLIQDRKRFLFMLNNMKDHILRYRKQTLMHPDKVPKSIDAHKKSFFLFKQGIRI